jgi:hypothetical protein
MFPALSPGPSSAQRARRQSGRSVARSGADRQGRWRPGGWGRRAWGSVTAPRIRRGPAQRGHTRTPIANRGHRAGTQATSLATVARSCGSASSVYSRFRNPSGRCQAGRCRTAPSQARLCLERYRPTARANWAGAATGPAGSWLSPPGGWCPTPISAPWCPSRSSARSQVRRAALARPRSPGVSTIDVSWSWSWKASEGQRATSEWRPHDRLTASINTEPHEVSLRGAGCDAYVPSSRRVVPPKPGLMFLGFHTVDPLKVTATTAGRPMATARSISAGARRTSAGAARERSRGPARLRAEDARGRPLRDREAPGDRRRVRRPARRR